MAARTHASQVLGPGQSAPSPAFWRGVSGIAESIERDIEALQHALDAPTKAKDAPDP